MTQSWHDLLFAHWPVPARRLQALLPRGLTLDLFAGQAWLGVVPFRMTGIRRRRFPPLPGLSAFPELNVRTYVSADGKPGVWFLSLDAGNRLAVAVARRWYHLPYYHAHMDLRPVGDRILYASRRVHAGAASADFLGTYRPRDDPRPAARGTLEHWLTERYCLYAADQEGSLYRAEIHHAPWPLQPAEAEIARNTLTEAHGVALPGTRPLLHFARRLDVVIWPLAPVRPVA
jgi:uncharacterized protein YqjF (DUF2071 family)